MLSGMTIRTRLLVIAGVPALALVATTLLLRSGAPAGTATIATAIAVVGVVIALVMATVVARTITVPLHRLGEAAERASHLQALVEALRKPGAGDRNLALTPVGLAPGGEIGTVAHAFDEFQGAAARLAVGQAALLNKTVAEKGTIEVFVNLARRMQSLVDHQIEFLDGLEAEEQDPGTLEDLFKLDQLATRVRRNAESLLTLAGAASARSWERPLAMSDVIRAGMAEVEDMGRVDLLVDEHSAMLGNAAADAAHLLSELIENATRWSPPDTRVDVGGTPAAGGYAITIEDSGIGMTGAAVAEANHILTGPPLAEATVARSLGLVVAGRLARRLGIVVRLAPASTGGIVAEVLVPPALMVAADGTLGLEEIAAGPQRALPFALARQEKRARISSQRSRGKRPLLSAQGGASITELPQSRRVEPAPVVAPDPVVGHEPVSVWDGPAAAVEPAWQAATADAQADDFWNDLPAPAAAVEPMWPAPEQERQPDEASWSSGEPEWPAADLAWPTMAGADSPADASGDDAWSTPDAAAPTVPAPVAAAPAPPAEPPVSIRPTPPAEPPVSIRPAPPVRPARFAAAPSRSLAGAAPRSADPSAGAKEDEYRRHLERATAAGLVRRVPNASLPKDTGGGATRAPKTGGDEPVSERRPDAVRSLLSSYRSGVQRGRAEGPDVDQRTTTPQEQP